MSTQVFPTSTQIPGVDITISRKVEWDTVVQTAISGKETRIARRQFPIRTFGLKFNFLRSSTSAVGQPAVLELQTLEGFFNSRQGMYDSFQWTDPDDHSVTGQGIGTGDSTLASFALVRSFGSFVEPVYAPNVVSNVYLNGVSQASSLYTVYYWGSTQPIGPGYVNFVTPPSNGVAVTADFTYYWPVRFTMDDMTFERFVNLIYENKKVEFKTII